MIMKCLRNINLHNLGNRNVRNMLRQHKLCNMYNLDGAILLVFTKMMGLLYN